jgi:hypothetical protein
MRILRFGLALSLTALAVPAGAPAYGFAPLTLARAPQ